MTVLPLCGLSKFQNFLPLHLTENTIDTDSGYHKTESISVKVT